ncbi:unnamed protein product [Tilletia controversa]|uniref:Uncharacterized protein n=1 Tax=Tilletia controversa TaxID=13291 RepID=A0A8X7MLU8_9BASI|nr:hypothetical protein CF328_g7611 [Tilletia controversa]KAE8241525.1 hypothetical protein A4X06_0g7504 [Tilletia controversa]CAD6982375.1 unnamed protein product [Tilletia controversa]
MRSVSSSSSEDPFSTLDGNSSRSSSTSDGQSSSSSSFSSFSAQKDRHDAHQRRLVQASFDAVTGHGSTTWAGIKLLDKRRATKGRSWECIASVPTQQLYQWFEAQHNYYSSNDFKLASCADIDWVGHPGDSSRDPSARVFFIHWKSTLSLADRKSATSLHGIVARHHFECAGRCSAPKTLSLEAESEAESEADIAEEGQLPTAKHKDKAKNSTSVPKACCAGNVRLLVEVNSKDLSKCVIYQKEHHQDTPDPSRSLQYSRRLRLYMMEIGSRSGMTASKLRKDLLTGNGLDAADAGALPRAFARPKWRLPSTGEVDSLMSGLCKASRLHTDPFVAVDWFAAENPSKVFGYVPLMIKTPNPDFSIGIKTTWSIRNLIRWHGRIIHLDSSWRNKNENRAPLTFVTTTNEAGHMVPCAAYLSANVTAANISHLLQALTAEVVTEAERICDTHDTMAHAIDSGDANLLVNARAIKKSGTWRPHAVMIDKYKAELNAIRQGEIIHSPNMFIKPS